MNLLVRSLISMFKEAPIHACGRKSRKDDFQKLKAGSDYYIIVFGYDEEVSTELQLIPFRTQPHATAGRATAAAR